LVDRQSLRRQDHHSLFWASHGVTGAPVEKEEFGRKGLRKNPRPYGKMTMKRLKTGEKGGAGNIEMPVLAEKDLFGDGLTMSSSILKKHFQRASLFMLKIMLPRIIFLSKLGKSSLVVMKPIFYILMWKRH